MKLKRLAPRLTAASTNRLVTLEAKAGTTQRMSGRAWMKERKDALIAGLFKCVDCGLVSASNEIDHDTPLEQGGANHPSNYRVRCIPCHAVKTKEEATRRSGRL